MENENSPVVIKETLYDKIFKPQKITLQNGHSVMRRRSRAPLILLLLAAAIVLSLKMTGFDMGLVIKKFGKMLDLMQKIWQPDWSFFPKVLSPLFDTIEMSILGTVIGCALALPVAILSSSNINHSVPLVSVCRFILALIRTLPTLIIALVCALIFSLGTFSGTVAIASLRSASLQKCSLRASKPSIWDRSRPWRHWARISSRHSGPLAFRRYCRYISATACTALR